MILFESRFGIFWWNSGGGRWFLVNLRMATRMRPTSLFIFRSQFRVWLLQSTVHTTEHFFDPLANGGVPVPDTDTTPMFSSPQSLLDDWQCLRNCKPLPHLPFENRWLAVLVQPIRLEAMWKEKEITLTTQYCFDLSVFTKRKRKRKKKKILRTTARCIQPIHKLAIEAKSSRLWHCTTRGCNLAAIPDRNEIVYCPVGRSDKVSLDHQIRETMPRILSFMISPLETHN